MLILDKGGGSGGGETATSVVTIESDPVTADTPEEFVYKRNVRRSIMYSNHSSNGSAQATNTGLAGLATNSIFCVSFFVKPVTCETCDPSSGKHYSLPLLPVTPLSLSCVLLPELQRYKYTISCAALSAEVQGHRQEQLPQTLIVRLLKLFYTDP